MPEDDKWKDLTRTGIFLLAVCVAGHAVLFFACDEGKRLVPLLTAFAAMSVAGMIGFLFAVPRVQQEHERHLETGAIPLSEPYRMHINTNLEQISDWLTKIVVGIGLSQLWNLPSLVNRVASFLSPAFGVDPTQSLVLAAVALVYFTCLGFLSGYLLTRIYLAGAFQRADAHVVVGLRVTPDELRQQQGMLLADLQSQVMSIRSGSSLEPPLEERMAGDGEADRVRSILWVDDTPEANVLMVERLQRIGVEVVIARTTAEALRLLSGRRFGRIISNMGRKEADRHDPAAGLTLIRKLRDSPVNTRIIIFCDANEAATYREVALNDGAYAVTSSPILLLAALDLEGSEATLAQAVNS